MQQSPKDLVPHFFDKTAQTYEKVATWATFGKDKYWKKEIVNKIDDANSILDLACGTGRLTRMIAAKFPRSRIIGLDISKSYLNIANNELFPNISFIHQDAEKMNIGEKFDCICSSYLPKYCDSKILIKRCMNHLNPGGSIIIHDFVYPENSMVRIFWKLHFVLLRFIGNFIPSWKYPFSELPKLIQKSKWIDQYIQELDKNGFDIRRQNLTWNSSVILHARKNT
ncbi:MAG: methyltransferase domain-containing protein [Nitrosopumilaceae archaeon]|jgi:demethylmenaquinone methyltransferase/2-methoxy-6-polyprenyl-1,4-benzoquinol methylase